MSVHDDRENRNPLLLPTDKEPVRMRGCPKCKANDYVGRNIQGVITYTCGSCKNQWQGGLPHIPQDPTIPQPAQDPLDRPAVDFVRDKHGAVQEVRRRVSTVQEFRKGLPFPNGED